MTQRSKPKKLPPFSLRLTFEERARLEELAGEEPLGSYIKRKVFDGKGAGTRRARSRVRRPVKDDVSLARLLAMLGNSRIANNLNQLAKAANIGALPVMPEVERDLRRACVSPGFGSLWLVPRLDRFRRQHPDIEIRIDGTDRLIDVAGGDADVAIRYGPGGYADVNSDRLFAMRATPVCSPETQERGSGLKDPQDLKSHTLLHVDWKETEGSWRTWLLTAGMHDINPFKGPRFTKEEMAVRAALDGEGVALIGDRMAANHLASGGLVRPFDKDLSTPLVFAYFLLTPRDRLDQPMINAFRTWVLAEASLEL